jgi:hypothetical protein
MRFLKELFQWFVYGRVDSAASIQNEPVVISQPAQVQEREPVQFDIVRDVRPMGFLQELRTIQPISKEFDRAREELIEELRKLSPRKRTKDRNR